MDKQERSGRRIIAIVVVVLLAAIGLVYAQSTKDQNVAADAAGEQTADAEAAKNEEKGKKKGKGEGEGDEEKDAPVPVEVAEIASDDVASYVSATANLVAENDVEILSEAEGRIQELLAEEGQRVAKGQPLARLVRGDAEIALAKAEAKAANARLAWERAQTMHAQDLLSQQELDRTAMEHRVAAEEVAEARWLLAKRTIVAPFTGRVTERFVDPGQNVKPGDRTFAVVDVDPLVARIYLPEKEVYGLEEGRPVAIALNATTEVELAGRIRQISPIVDTATGTVKVTVEAVSPPPSVRPGAFVTVRVVREQREAVPVVPRQAVIRELEAAHVFVAADGKAAKRAVTLGLEDGGRIEVVTGLAPGEQVIVAGQGGLKEGAAIKIIEKAPVA